MSRPMRLLHAWALALVAATAIGADPAGRPDLSGTWLPDGARAEPWPSPLPLTPDAQRFVAEFNPADNDPTTFCMPFGTPRNVLQTQFPLQIVQTPARLVMILQPNLANAEVRRIPLDGGALPADPDPTWFGTSRGRWDGATLVVETNGLRDDSLISGQGLPHSARLKVTERLSLVQDARLGTVLLNEVELEDPMLYTAPLRTRRYFVRAPAAQFTEESCVARQWIDKLWHDRLLEHAEAGRAAGGAR